MLLSTYGVIGLLAGLTAALLMDPGSGKPWLASLIGIDGALIGQYLDGRYIGSGHTAGTGAGLFLSALGSFLLLSAYRTAFRWKLDAEKAPIRSQETT